MNMTIPVARGCGERQDDSLYLCVGTSPDGIPIEKFALDPVKPWSLGSFRAPMLIDLGDVSDVAIWVGREFYPFVPDYVEETRRFGLSRRIPKGFPVEKLSANSKIILVHARAIPEFPYELSEENSFWKAWCKKFGQHARIRNDLNTEPCAFHLWDLSALEPEPKLHEVSPVPPRPEDLRVTCPSFSYDVIQPISPSPSARYDLNYSPGVFMAIHASHLEIVRPKKETFEDVRSRARMPVVACEK